MFLEFIPVMIDSYSWDIEKENYFYLKVENSHGKSKDIYLSDEQYH